MGSYVKEGEKQVFHEVIPANARILVDYDKPPKERVKFAYPKQYTFKKALWKNYLPILLIWGIILVGAFFISALEQLAIDGGWLLGFYLKVGFPTLGVITPGVPLAAHIQIMPILEAIGELLLIFLPPALFIYWLGQDKERTASVIPTLNYKLDQLLHFGTHCYIEVSPSDVVDKLFAIPRFSNVYLDYKATGDFSTYLQKVEVMEYPYNYSILKPNGKVSKKRINEYVWRGLFRFSQQPKTGMLYVKYI